MEQYYSVITCDATKVTIFKIDRGIEGEKRGREGGREKREDEHGGCF